MERYLQKVGISDTETVAEMHQISKAGQLSIKVMKLRLLISYLLPHQLPQASN